MTDKELDPGESGVPLRRSLSYKPTGEKQVKECLSQEGWTCKRRMDEAQGHSDVYLPMTREAAESRQTVRIAA